MEALYYDLRAPAYTHNLTTLKQYGSSRYKLTQIACVRTRGVEIECPPKGSVNSSKLDNNITRARSKVQEYGLCNDWEFFVTLTIDGSKLDRFDLHSYWGAFGQFIRDYRKKYGVQVGYLFIPEQHQSGAWHAHGFLRGIRTEHLRQFLSNEKLPYRMLERIESGTALYDWPLYREKFGFISLEPIRSKERAVSYISKYITKDLARSVNQLGAHLYYVSRGLQQAQELKRGELKYQVPVDFENEHCAISWFEATEFTAEQLKGLIQSPYERKEN